MRLCRIFSGVCRNFIFTMKNDEREMPVLWHQCLLALCQRYKNDFSPEQKAAIMDLIRVCSAYQRSGFKNLASLAEMLARCQSSNRCVFSLWPTVSSVTVPHISQRRWALSNSNDSVRADGPRSLIRSLRITSASDIVLASPVALRPYLQIMRIDKPIGTWLLYWPCTWSIALATPAGQLPSLYYLTLFGVGAILMRSAGCVINDLFDKEFDKKMNWFSVAVGSASMFLVVGYPLAKRYTYWPQFVLGEHCSYNLLESVL
ncbi:hypothetical protein OSTOST_24677 [Ostertagia ostertagi]